VYPRIRRGQTREPGGPDSLKSNSAALDELLGGGLARGTSTLITGAAGTGKTVLSMQYVCAAVERGERVRMFMFDERTSTFHARAQGLGMDLSAPIADGRLTIVQIEPTQMSPGEFANEVVRAVQVDHVTLLVIDSVNGYMNAMPTERLLGVQLHELLSFLADHGVSSVLTLVQRGVFGGPVDEAAEVSYLADTVVLLRYFEFQGAVRGAISVVKKRSGPHEHTIRECRVAEGGLKVGQPLTEFRGVLTGVPEYMGPSEPLMNGKQPS
jgi:circadian clock protein KaiC